MNARTFNDLLNRRIQKIRDTLSKKANEYVREEDRLYNFKRAAEKKRCTPAQALDGMMAKHEVSVQDLIDFPAMEIDKESYLKLIDEKIGDNINYLILLEAILKEDLLESL